MLYPIIYGRARQLHPWRILSALNPSFDQPNLTSCNDNLKSFNEIWRYLDSLLAVWWLGKACQLHLKRIFSIFYCHMNIEWCRNKMINEYVLRRFVRAYQLVVLGYSTFLYCSFCWKVAWNYIVGKSWIFWREM